MKESPIEDLFFRLWTDAGGRVYKWVSPGNNGVPDRIAFLHGMVFLVELKATKGRLRTTQKIQHRELRMHGFDVVVLSSIDQVREWIEAQLDAMQVNLLADDDPKVAGSVMDKLAMLRNPFETQPRKNARITGIMRPYGY